FAYTPAAGFVGTDQFTYKAADGLASSAPAAVTLTVTDQAPSSGNDSYRTARNAVLNVPTAGVLGNDGDADGDALRAVLVSGPSHGALALNPDGSFTYTPAHNFQGTDSFQYQASDGALNSNAATVTINVVRPRQVANIQVNDGSAQRSMVTSLTVTFD